MITAFNFPVAVWSWNATLAAVCGDATIWKPSEKTPLTAIAVTKIAERVCRETGADPAIFTLLVGDRKTVGQKLADDPRIPLVSATGSTNMGFNVAKAVNGRLGRTILELGGNNALIVTPSADLDMAVQSIFFGAVGQSRMLYGLTIQSERPSHRLMEQWHPLGVVAVITAFNFPVAVWSWNAALAAVCGDATIWKPSEKTPLTAIAVTKIAERV